MIFSRNEWDQLKTCIVGRADNANWPRWDPVFQSELAQAPWRESPPPRGPVPEWIIEEANQDLEILSDTLTELGVEVLRPDDFNFQAHDGMYNYCPRDRFLVWEDKVVDVAMLYPCRDMERQCYNHIFDSLIEMPRHQGLILDAANIARLNDTWLYLESSSGNRAAYDWLCQAFPQVNIELCNFYRGVHIDSTVLPLREGLVLLNGSRVNDTNMPKAIKNWDKIYVNDVVERDFYQYPYASKWIGINLLVVSPDTVIVDKKQTEVIRQLEDHKFTVVPLELRHSRTLGGGFHCTTLDIRRESA